MGLYIKWLLSTHQECPVHEGKGKTEELQQSGEAREK